MRTLTDHVVEGDTAPQLTINVLDEPGHGGACHEYLIGWIEEPGTPVSMRVQFQNGPIKEFGVNGITETALLAIVIDRLRSFQTGPFACNSNLLALRKVDDALFLLQGRTRDRIACGVEWTSNA